MEFVYQTRKPLKRPIKPKSFVQGEQFEAYAREFIFPPDYYRLLHRTSNYEQNISDFPEDAKDPDFAFVVHGGKKKFHIECKFRNFSENWSQMDNVLQKYKYDPQIEMSAKLDQEIYQALRPYAQIDIYKKPQFLRHRKLNTVEPVFICLGLYDEKNSDILVFVFPISSLLCHFTRVESLENFVVPNNFPFPPEGLAELSMPEKDAFCIQCRAAIVEDPEQPFCEQCWPDWYSKMNFRRIENHCHTCGKAVKTTAARPDCPDCYRKNVDTWRASANF